MIFKKDNLLLGIILGLIAPFLGLVLFKIYKFGIYTYSDTIDFMLHEQGFRTLSVALTLSLLVNAGIFTLYINTRRDKTATGIFVSTLVYGITILLIKTFA
jgi:hypothetical protein